ncbi:MAG: Mur ligase family protein, partial [bacterium]|nr:Mur ligase family protein [bacterium]
ELLKNHGFEDALKKKTLLDKTRGWNVERRFGEEYLSDVESADIIFAPQSWMLFKEENAKLFGIQEKLRNIMHLYLELAPCEVIGVTGSDGKTTTAHLITHLLKSAGRKVWLSGNYRHGEHVLEQIRDLNQDGYLVLEISNRHLNFGFSSYPDISVITNVTQNHITEYENFEQYKETKARILGPETISVLNLDNQNTRSMGGLAKTDFFFSRVQETNGAFLSGTGLIMGEQNLCSLSDISLPGDHNVENTLAAVTVARLLELTSEEITAGVQSFAAVKERLELSAIVGGKRIINDLAATSAESTRRGILAFQDDVLTVVLGGETKGVDYELLADAIKESKARIFGIKSEVTDALEKLGVNVSLSDTITEAIRTAYQKTPTGGVLLISPAGAFFQSRYMVREGLTMKKIISLLQSLGTE